jgi:hypothetical protein
MKQSRLWVGLVVSFLLFAFHLPAQQPGSAGSTPSPAAVLAASQSSPGTVPRFVEFSGVVTAARSGKTGVVTLTFSLYQEQEGGTPLWVETQNVQVDEKGRYTVLLGATQPDGLPLDPFATGQARWLGVQPGLPAAGEQPRVLLVGVPYALKAADADTLGGMPASAFVMAGAQVVSSEVISSALSSRTDAAGPRGDGAQVGSEPETPDNLTITGGGRPNTIPIFTGPAKIGNSLIAQSRGAAVVKEVLELPSLETATASTGFNSQPFDLLSSSFSSSTKRAIYQHFRWQAEPVGNNTSSPSGRFNLLFASGRQTPAETGLSISSTGIITFASGQTLPAVTGSEVVTGEITANNSAGQAGSFTSTNEGSTGLAAFGGGGSSGAGGGIGIIANGGNEGSFTSGNGGVGLIASGGNTYSENYIAGAGIYANGGHAFSGSSGAGIVAKGGYAPNLCCAGAGVDATGGIGGDGVGVLATGGAAFNPDEFGESGIVAIGGMGGSNSVGGDGISASPGTGGTGGAFAGYFSGDVNVTGTLTSGVKDFRIDHPLDPANKYLYHSSVESSEMMNIYTGNAILDASGHATVQLPAWFQAENSDFRYQVTAIGAPAPGLYIAQEIQNNTFGIAGGQAGMKVSWQVTAVRHDAYVKAHPLVVEVNKPANERGYFIHPELYGAPAEKSIEWARHPDLMKLIKEKRDNQEKEARAMRVPSASHAKQ